MKSKDLENFDSVMRVILNADPKAVKAAVDAEIQANTEVREARGERKRGRKPKAMSPSAHASDAKD